MGQATKNGLAHFAMCDIIYVNLKGEDKMDSNNVYSQISKYYKSFSGTDTLAFILMPGSTPVVLGSLTTISYSMFRNKKPVINIGRTNINGVTRGSRIFAGTMVFTLINQHWLKELQDQLDWLKEFEELKVDELPLFDIMIISANEYGNYVSMYIYGIDFTDEAQTISVEDLFTENVFSFVARDISVFKAGADASMKKNDSRGHATLNKFTQKFYVLDSSMISLNEIGQLESAFTKAALEAKLSKPAGEPLLRTLFYSTTKTMIGSDVAKLQELLNGTKMYHPLNITGVFDELTDKCVRHLQSVFGLDIDGVVTEKFYNMLLNAVSPALVQKGLVINKYGAYVYQKPYIGSSIVDTKQYRTHIPILEVLTGYEDETQKFYKTDTGYVTIEDIYSSHHAGNLIEFPIVEYGDKSHYVTMIQTALADIFPNYTNISGEYDYQTRKQIEILQEENGFEPNGIVTNDIWLLLQSLAGNVVKQISNDNFKLEFDLLPGVYDMNPVNTLDEVKLFTVKASCDNPINIKASAICIYDDNNSETLTSTIRVKEPQVISLENLKNAFVYNPKYGKQPKSVDYIIYPYNKKPYKWTINYAKG